MKLRPGVLGNDLGGKAAVQQRIVALPRGDRGGLLQGEVGDFAASKGSLIFPTANGPRRRRAEGIPLLVEKFKNTAETCFSGSRTEEILSLFETVERLDAMAADEFAGRFAQP